MNKRINRSFYVNGKILRKTLSLRGITQKELANTLNVAENTIYRIIKYNRMENKDDFISICKILNIQPTLLLNESPYYPFKDDNKSFVDDSNLERYISSFDYNDTSGMLLDLDPFFSNTLAMDVDLRFDIVDDKSKEAMNKHFVLTREILYELYIDYEKSNSKNSFEKYLKDNLISKLRKYKYK